MSSGFHSYGQEPSFHGQAPASILQPGQLADRFELVRMLGHGGMGQAWLAIDPRRKDEEREGYVVLKFLPDALRHHPDATHDFRAAYCRVQALHHESICPLFDLEESPDLGCFQVMQYIPGFTLREIMRSSDPKRTGMDLERVIWYLQPIARALDYAHQNNIIHRDIKPDNVIVDPATVEVHVIDFGLAAELRTSMSRYSQQRLSVSGTESYMPHEQWLGQPQDGRSDQYSLAVVAWELLAGQLPFQGSGMQLAYAVAQAPVPTLPEHLRHLQSVFDRALSKDRDQRFDSVEAFVKSLSGGENHETAVNDQITKTKARSSSPSQTEDLAGQLLKTQAELTRINDKARQRLVEYDYAGAVAIFEKLPSHLRNQDLYRECKDKHGRSSELEKMITSAVKELRLDGLYDRVKELSLLQPQRSDLKRLLDHLPQIDEKSSEPFRMSVPFDRFMLKAGLQACAKQFRLKKEYKNRLGMKFQLIPPGKFMMGSNYSETGRTSSEIQHTVELNKPYYLATTAVTQKPWSTLMKTTPWKGRGNVREGAEFPATYISWLDTQEFIERLNKLGNLQYRLPTEAEWEYGCRAGSDRTYCFGDEESLLNEYAWTAVNTDQVGEGYTHQVGQKSSNLFGLYDMHGNVWEWCQDWYHKDYYFKSPRKDPTGPESGLYRIRRGGSWCNSAEICRSANRHSFVPSSGDYYLGFRIALVPDV